MKFCITGLYLAFVRLSNCKENAASSRGSSTSCSVYLAPSSIPNGGMGMFVGKDFKAGDIILPADGPAIPIIDPDGNSERSMRAWTQLFSNYWWETGSAVATKFEADYAVDYQITMGALPNSHVMLDNLGDTFPAVIPYDDSMADRYSHPGAGAFSYHMGRQTMAETRDMEAGEELFLSYNTQYMDFLSKKYNIPNHDDYTVAGNLLSLAVTSFGSKVLLEEKSKWDYISNFLSQPSSFAGGESIEEKSKWDYISDFLDQRNISDRAKTLLPKSQLDLEKVLRSAGESLDASGLAFAMAKELSVEKRSVEWIKENGICLDNILPGKSSSPHAGMGAIAQRRLEEGTVVAPASLLQVNDRDALRMPAFEEEQMQLLLNYCFGRDDSSLLLCPNTNAVLINHCSSRRPDLHPCGSSKSPNAKYRWATWDKSTKLWLNKTLDDIANESGRGLSLEIVAKSVIEEGEEVFIDYGEEWEAAWDDHLKKWKILQAESSGTCEMQSESSCAQDSEWKSVKELNDELLPLTIVADFSDDMDDITNVDSRGLLFTGCFYQYYETDFWDRFDDEDFWDQFDDEEPWREMEFEEVIDRYSYPADGFDLDPGATYTDNTFWPCDVIRKDNDDDEGFYTVRILQHSEEPETAWGSKEFPEIISNYPRGSIRHFYKPYKSDLHLPHAFRHHIVLDDEIFPEQWKDRKEG